MDKVGNTDANFDAVERHESAALIEFSLKKIPQLCVCSAKQFAAWR